jgi:hypothetical protein
MTTTTKHGVSLYVDRGYTEHWIVRDVEGRFWTVPPGENAWDRPQPFQPTEETRLTSIPGHYKYLLGLPV